MRFPLSLTRSMTAYLLRKKLAGQQMFPLVLMLEPLHACNLSCTGCGRIREYADTMHRRLSVEQCLAAVAECGAPIVSVCGGEPLIYPEIEPLVACLVEQRKHVYLCTNGVLLEKKLRGFRPSSRLFINVHLDGMEATHDRMVEREGVFAAAVRGILDAKTAGFQVCTNTTVYRDTDMHEVAVLFDYLYELGVDGFMISPAFGYESVAASNPEGGGADFHDAARRSTRNSARPARSSSDSGSRPRRSTWNFSAANGNWTAPLGRIPPTTSAAGAVPAICSATPITKPTASWSMRPTGASSVPRAIRVVPTV